MNKKIAVIVLLGFVLSIGIAFAHPGARNGDPQGNRNFVDEDGDGICDNYQSGQCQGYGYRNGNGFVDEDGDGICDNYQSGQCQGYGYRNGNGFVDEDGDGICDNCQGTCTGGYHHGNGMGRGRP